PGRAVGGLRGHRIRVRRDSSSDVSPFQRDRRRRTRGSGQTVMTMKRFSIGWMLAAALLVAHSAAAGPVIFLVRHAERAAAPPNQPPGPAHGMLGEDPPLSPAGEQRA